MDWLEIYISIQSMTICKIKTCTGRNYLLPASQGYFEEEKTLDWLKVYTSNQSRISIVTPSLEVYTFNQYMDWSEVYNSRLVMVILECLGTFGIQKKQEFFSLQASLLINLGNIHFFWKRRVYYEIHMKTTFKSADSLKCPQMLDGHSSSNLLYWVFAQSSFRFGLDWACVC